MYLTFDTQKQNNAKYDSEYAAYEKALQNYNQTVSGKPTIVANGNTKLVGTAGAPGSIGYYSGMSVVSTDTGYTSLGQVSWNSNTQLIGTSKKANLTDKQGKLADGDESNFYDITDIVHNNGTITLTNVTKDSYGNSYDLKLGFTNTDSPINVPSTVIIGPANDGSIEFDFYGGFETANAGVYISSLQFVYHGTNVAAPVLMNSLFSDLDVTQSFETNLGNKLSWTPSDSNVSIIGNTYLAKDDTDFQGFNSSPKGTGVMVGQGSNFYYRFYNGSHNGRPAGTGISADGFDNGTQFNLFGQGASLAQSPTPPIRQTTTANYHYDTT